MAVFLIQIWGSLHGPQEILRDLDRTWLLFIAGSSLPLGRLQDRRVSLEVLTKAIWTWGLRTELGSPLCSMAMSESFTGLVHMSMFNLGSIGTSLLECFSLSLC